MKTGAQLIADERKRQVREEGHSAQNDDGWRSGEINDAAIGYAQCAAHQARGQSWDWIRHALHAGEIRWPWEDQWFKPSPDPIRNLTMAGALMAAEIDRLQRIKSHP